MGKSLEEKRKENVCYNDYFHKKRDINVFTFDFIPEILIKYRLAIGSLNFNIDL